MCGGCEVQGVEMDCWVKRNFSEHQKLKTYCVMMLLFFLYLGFFFLYFLYFLYFFLFSFGIFF